MSRYRTFDIRLQEILNANEFYTYSPKKNNRRFVKRHNISETLSAPEIGL